MAEFHSQVALDPSAAGTGVTLSNGNLTANTSADKKSVLGNTGVSSGKVYWEITVDAQDNSNFMGVATASANVENEIGNDAYGWAYKANDGSLWHNSSGSSFGSTYGAGDILGFALDMDAGKLWIAKNGAWQDSGDPGAGTDEAVSGLTGAIYPGIGLRNSSCTATAVFAASDFTYTMPSGFTVISGYADGVALGDSMEAELETPHRDVSGGVGLGDSMDVNVEYGVAIEDGVGAGETSARSREVIASISDGVGLGDTVEVFNWTDWIEQNLSRAVKRFYLTLTGTADGTTDLDLPMSSFQARRRSGDPTYLEAVIPNIDDYSAGIAARSSGDLVLELAYLLGGEEVVRETLLTVSLENIDMDEGGRSQSITLRGHRTETFVANSVTLSGVSYVAQRYGKMHARTAVPDPYLQPGDTVTVDGNTFTADIVTYVVTPTTQLLEVQEAAA